MLDRGFAAALRYVRSPPKGTLTMQARIVSLQSSYQPCLRVCMAWREISLWLWRIVLQYPVKRASSPLPGRWPDVSIASSMQTPGVLAVIMCRPCTIQAAAQAVQRPCTYFKV